MPVNNILVEKICRLMCTKRRDDPDSKVFRGQAQTINQGLNMLWTHAPQEHNIQPMWTIYQQDVRMVLEILENGEFILDKAVAEENHYTDQAQGATKAAVGAPTPYGIGMQNPLTNYGNIAGAAKKGTP